MKKLANSFDEITEKRDDLYERMVKVAFTISDINISESRYEQNEKYVKQVESVFEEVEKFVKESEEKVKNLRSKL